MTLKSRGVVWAENLHDRTQMDAQMRYLAWLRQEYQIDAGTAIEWVNSEGPEHADIRLGYKMADPIVQLAMWGPRTSKAKKIAQEKFRNGLDEWERAKWDEEVSTMGAGDRFRAALKRGRKKEGKK